MTLERNNNCHIHLWAFSLSKMLIVACIHLNSCGLEDYPYLYPNASILVENDLSRISFTIPNKDNNQNLSSIFFKGYKLLYRIYPKKNYESLGNARSSDEAVITSLNTSAQTTIAVKIQEEIGLAFKSISFGMDSMEIIPTDSPIEDIDFIKNLDEDVTVTIDFGFNDTNRNFPIIIIKDASTIYSRALRFDFSSLSRSSVEEKNNGDFKLTDEQKDYDAMEILIYVVAYGINMNEGASTIFSETKKIGVLELP